MFKVTFLVFMIKVVLTEDKYYYYGFERKNLFYIHNKILNLYMEFIDKRITHMKENWESYDRDKNIFSLLDKHKKNTALKTIIDYIVDDTGHSFFNSLYKISNNILKDNLIKYLTSLSDLWKYDIPYKTKIFNIIEIIENEIKAQSDIIEGTSFKFSEVSCVAKTIIGNCIEITKNGIFMPFYPNYISDVHELDDILVKNLTMEEISIEDFFDDEKMINQFTSFINSIPQKSNTENLYIFFDFNTDFIVFEFAINCFFHHNGDCDLDDLNRLIEDKINLMQNRMDTFEYTIKIILLASIYKQSKVYVCDHKCEYLKAYYEFIVFKLLKPKHKSLKIKKKIFSNLIKLDSLIKAYIRDKIFSWDAITPITIYKLPENIEFTTKNCKILPKSDIQTPSPKKKIKKLVN